MFSPVGKKKLLLQIKRAKEQGRDKDVQALVQQAQALSPNLDLIDYSKPPPKPNRGDDFGSMEFSAGNGKTNVVSTSNLVSYLMHEGDVGAAFHRLLHATSRYRPEDRIVLRMFESKKIEYSLFRQYLQTAFWLSFEEREWEALKGVLDKPGTGFIDGYQFMIGFIKLGGIRKDREAEDRRQRETAYLRRKELDAEQERLEQERKMELAARFDFSEEVQAQAVKKLLKCCKDFDPTHPQSPSLDNLLGVPYVRAAELREIFKNIFKLTIDRKELGVVLTKYYKDTGSSSASKKSGKGGATSAEDEDDDHRAKQRKDSEKDLEQRSKMIPCGDFLKYMLRIGLELRDRERAHNIQKQRALNAQADEEQRRREEAKAGKLGASIDFDWSEKDSAVAMEKLREAATKYDKNGPGAGTLVGFECSALSAVEFKDLVRRTFNLQLCPKELAWVLREYGDGVASVTCGTFLTKFLKLGIDERYKLHIKQLERQRAADEQAEKDHLAKIKEVSEKKTFRISFLFGEEDTKSAVAKMTAASTKYDASRGVSLASFEPQLLSQSEFNDAIARTFSLRLNPRELGAVVQMLNTDKVQGLADMTPEEKRAELQVHCQSFLNSFFALGHAERDRFKKHTLRAQREAEVERRRRDAELLEAQANKLNIEIDYDFTPEERDAALVRLTDAATRYDKAHPASKGLEGFDAKTIPPTLFKEMLRRVFDLNLSAKETGALVEHFCSNGDRGIIVCKDFLNVFLQLGIGERAKFHKQQLDRQTEENRARVKEDQKKVERLVLRPIDVDMSYSSKDGERAMAKMLRAAEGFDKNHPAAPSLASFEAAFQTYGQFKDSIVRTFNIKLQPKELGYVCGFFDPEKSGKINSKDFLIKFNGWGKDCRDRKHSEQLKRQREASEAAKRHHEDLIKAQWSVLEAKQDWEWGDADWEGACAKIEEASELFDKGHPAAPSLAGFTGGEMKAVEFDTLLRSCFNLWLAPKELSALIQHFPYNDKGRTIDSKAFLNKFLQMGFEMREKKKSRILDKQRRAAADREVEEQRKKKIMSQKTHLDLGAITHSLGDKRTAMEKLLEASAKYDKNAPGCVSLEAFDAKFLTPLQFREQLKRTFNVRVSDAELAALVKEFDPERAGNVQSQAFLISFLKMGAEERGRLHSVQLALQRQQNLDRKNEHARKMAEAALKMSLRLENNYSPEDRESAFFKYTKAAKKYDRNHPGSMSLDGFEEAELDVVTFKEMIRRTFGLALEPPELAALVHFFDEGGKGKVPSKPFLRHFLKAGIEERAVDHRASLESLRASQVARERQHQEKLQSQWAKMELGLKSDFDQIDKDRAIQKLTDAAFKFDPRAAGPMGLTAFQGKSMSAAIFREMLKRSFFMAVTDRELAALMSLFLKNEKNELICQDFMLKFNQLGFERRSERRLRQLELQRSMTAKSRDEEAAKKKMLADKTVVEVDTGFSKEDFDSAFSKLRGIAAHYELGSSTAPSLQGFMGSDMTPGEFKDMLFRTFSVALSLGELGALLTYFDSSGNGLVDTQDFLAYFYKAVRDEHDVIRKQNIMVERSLKRRKDKDEEEKEKKKQQHESSKLVYTADDEESFLAKLRKATQLYAVDSSSFIAPMQAFKGPALDPESFRELFNHIFLIRFSFPEIGVLLSILDHQGNGVLDGPRLLNWFYKICRWEEKIMLGEVPDNVTLQQLKVNAAKAFLLNGPGDGSAAGSRQVSRSNSPTPQQFQRLPAAGSPSAGANSVSALFGMKNAPRAQTAPANKQRAKKMPPVSEAPLIDDLESMKKNSVYMPPTDPEELDMQEPWIPDVRYNSSFSRDSSPSKASGTPIHPLMSPMQTDQQRACTAPGGKRGQVAREFMDSPKARLFSSSPEKAMSMPGSQPAAADPSLFQLNSVADGALIDESVKKIKAPRTGVAAELQAVQKQTRGVFGRHGLSHAEEAKKKKNTVKLLLKMNNNMSKSFDASQAEVQAVADTVVGAVDALESAASTGKRSSDKARPKNGGKSNTKAPAVSGFYFPTLMAGGSTL